MSTIDVSSSNNINQRSMVFFTCLSRLNRRDVSFVPLVQLQLFSSDTDCGVVKLYSLYDDCKIQQNFWLNMIYWLFLFFIIFLFDKTSYPFLLPILSLFITNFICVATTYFVLGSIFSFVESKACSRDH